MNTTTYNNQILPQRKPLMANSVLGTTLFVIVEIMFFMALISAYLVIRAGMTIAWTPPSSVTLPVMLTGFNTLMLMLSGYLLYKVGVVKKSNLNLLKLQQLYYASIVLGFLFVAFQGIEWFRLIQNGMTLHSGIFSSTFYLLIGTHGLHALSAIAIMAAFIPRVKAGTITLNTIHALQIYWFFIVLIWPILYGLVYF